MTPSETNEGSGERDLLQREFQRLHERLDRLESSLADKDRLEAELRRSEANRQALADQAAHLIQTLGEARREANWFKRKLEESTASEP